MTSNASRKASVRVPVTNVNILVALAATITGTRDRTAARNACDEAAGTSRQTRDEAAGTSQQTRDTAYEIAHPDPETGEPMRRVSRGEGSWG
eukprot:5569607-Prymnesium_polylepis.1